MSLPPSVKVLSIRLHDQLSRFYRDPPLLSRDVCVQLLCDTSLVPNHLSSQLIVWKEHFS